MNRWPLVLPHPTARRILERRASALVSTGRVQADAYCVHDSLTIRRNERLRTAGRFEEQQDPEVCAIDVTEVAFTTLLELDYPTLRACGFKTQRDFYDEWISRRRGLDPRQEIYTVRFRLIDPPRFLHRRTFSGYTSNPAMGMLGEPEALSPDELRHLAAGARARHERERRVELCLERARSISLRIRAAAREGRPDEVLALRTDLEHLAEAMAPTL